MNLLSCFTAPTRRVQLIAGISLLLYFIIFHTQTAKDYIPNWPHVGFSTGQTRPVRRPYDNWQPPYDWNGERIVWDNFRNLNEQFSASVKNLKGQAVSSHSSADLFPTYNQRQTSSKNEPNEFFVSCKGPRGKRFNESDRDIISRFTGKPRDFAEIPIGSSSLVGFEQDACYDRFGRHSAYGLRDVGKPGQHQYDRFEFPLREGEVDWDQVDWGELQDTCYSENKHRFDISPRPLYAPPARVTKVADNKKQQNIPRTAVVFRAHDEYQYTEEVKRNLRALINELSLYSGGEYAAFLFVHVKDVKRDIWGSHEEYQKAIDQFVPAEFRNIAVLWNTASWKEQYPKIDEEYLNVHLSQWLPMQFFQKKYPAFDYYWNWELDIRYTGHYLDLLKAVDDFTQSQPRKGLWERNERFYIPRAHGTYEQFRDNVQARYQKDNHGVKTPDASVWGPHFPGGKINQDQQNILGLLNTKPPVASPDEDNFEWGVGEPADFMTFLPMFSPYPSKYVYRSFYLNYHDVPEKDVHRRTTIITLARLSSRLLQLMEAENTASTMHHMSSETWPHSVSLHYGLKAVYVPHGIYMEQDWPTNALDFVFNNGDQGWTLTHHPQRDMMNPHGEGSGGPESPFGLHLEHSWERTTWYYRNRLAERLYKRWMGWEYDNIGGQEWEEEHGHFCLPPMLLHPIKTIFGPEEGFAV